MDEHCRAYADFIARNWSTKATHLIERLTWGEIRAIVDLRIRLFGAH